MSFGSDTVFFMDDDADGIAMEPALPGEKPIKTEFFMTQEIEEQIHYSEFTSLSDFVGQINDLRDESAMKRLTIKSVEQWLAEEGYLENQPSGGMILKKLTEKGEEFGILAENRVSERGTQYQRFSYTEKGQRGIVAWLLSR